MCPFNQRQIPQTEAIEVTTPANLGTSEPSKRLRDVLIGHAVVNRVRTRRNPLEKTAAKATVVWDHHHQITIGAHKFEMLPKNRIRIIEVLDEAKAPDYIPEIRRVRHKTEQVFTDDLSVDPLVRKPPPRSVSTPVDVLYPRNSMTKVIMKVFHILAREAAYLHEAHRRTNR